MSCVRAEAKTDQAAESEGGSRPDPNGTIDSWSVTGAVRSASRWPAASTSQLVMPCGGVLTPRMAG